MLWYGASQRRFMPIFRYHKTEFMEVRNARRLRKVRRVALVLSSALLLGTALMLLGRAGRLPPLRLPGRASGTAGGVSTLGRK